MSVLDECNDLFMYLCDVESVRQLCTFSFFIYMGCCEDYLTCDIAFNAVLPLSRASTRGRYSRIEGVTKTLDQVWICIFCEHPHIICMGVEADDCKLSGYIHIYINGRTGGIIVLSGKV